MLSKTKAAKMMATNKIVLDSTLLVVETWASLQPIVSQLDVGFRKENGAFASRRQMIVGHGNQAHCLDL